MISASVQFLVICLPLEGDSVIFTSVFGPLVGFILLSRLCQGFGLVWRSQSQGRRRSAALKEDLFEEKEFCGRRVHLKSKQRAGQTDQNGGGLHQLINYPKVKMPSRITQEINGLSMASSSDVEYLLHESLLTTRRGDLLFIKNANRYGLSRWGFVHIITLGSLGWLTNAGYHRRWCDAHRRSAQRGGCRSLPVVTGTINLGPRVGREASTI